MPDASVLNARDLRPGFPGRHATLTALRMCRSIARVLLQRQRRQLDGLYPATARPCEGPAVRPR